MSQMLELARNVFDIESKAISNLKKLLTEDFERTVKTVLDSKGRFVITGMGKSGHIGVKISATLASTGTPSFFMHPAEAIHGDLGMLTKDDVVLAISNSGESEEIVKIIPLVKKMGITLIGMAGNPNSSLAKNSDYFLNISVEKEACPLELAPTSSTTVTLAMGDALAVALMTEREFQPEDFAMFHPGGSLGRKLLTKVKDIMYKDNIPMVSENSKFQDVIESMTLGRLGLAIVMEKNELIGIITDGDLRRALNNTKEPRFEITASEMMSLYPKTVDVEDMASDAEALMIEEKVNELVVLENNNIVGIVQLYDTGRV